MGRERGFLGKVQAVRAVPEQVSEQVFLGMELVGRGPATLVFVARELVEMELVTLAPAAQR